MIQAISTVIIPVFIIIAFGYFSTVPHFFKINEIQFLTRFAQNIALPCLLFINIYDLDLYTVFNINLLLTFYISASICFCLGVFRRLLFFFKI